MNNVILFVFEGKRIETGLLKSIQNLFFGEKPIIYAIFGAEIYQLWEEIAGDPDLDLVDLLRERDVNQLQGIRSSDISEVHLFFDHDSHANFASPQNQNAIAHMIDWFDNETGNGKLYLSYPMAEAIKDCKRDLNECFECEAYISANIHYKELVNSRSDFRSVKDYSRDDWIFLIAVTILKASRLVFGTYGSRNYQEFMGVDQQAIFVKQLELFIRPRRSVVILGAIPFFIIGYFGKDLYDELRLPDISKHCSFFCISP